MRIGIAGAGAVGRSVAQELTASGHQVLLIERNPGHFDPRAAPRADWFLADACELSSLQECGLQTCDVVIAATGEDKVNLAVSLLAKSEFGVSRVVARVNDADNEWLFAEAWGVDVAVSAPRAMVAAVEGAIDVGRLVQVMGMGGGQANLSRLTLPDDSPLVGRQVCEVMLPDNAALIVVLRGDRVIVAQPEEVLAAGDELLFVAASAVEHQIMALVPGE